MAQLNRSRAQARVKSVDYPHPCCIDETTTKTISSSSFDHPRRTNLTPDLEFALGFLPFRGLQDDEIELLLVKGEKTLTVKIEEREKDESFMAALASGAGRLFLCSPTLLNMKMSQGAFKVVLEKLASDGYNLENAIDLRSHWAKHGTNKFVTIRWVNFNLFAEGFHI
ncbi:hypothetical protein L1987_38936 [Smallanthus sonchifolius]|uniref:Uncharacterized protein n=1 Tax=Smallanthus sonchifolius TaxID=185202 RepID=A0ACB9HK15_9ASTR|nr:hypothetical protein L1987_38936 [Smallanthus sonchifolius]